MAHSIRSNMADDNRLPKQRIGLGALICGHIVLCCISLFYVAHFQHPSAFQPAQYHMLYNPARLYLAAIAVACFAPVSLLFVYSRFSFGYFCGFGFYTMIAGYLWLNCFSDLNYDHQLAGLSAAISAVAFLVPALLISSRIRQTYVLSEKALRNLLWLIFLLGVANRSNWSRLQFSNSQSGNHVRLPQPTRTSALHQLCHRNNFRRVTAIRVRLFRDAGELPEGGRRSVSATALFLPSTSANLRCSPRHG